MVEPVVWYSDITKELYTSEEHARQEDSLLDSKNVMTKLHESYQTSAIKSSNLGKSIVVSVRKIQRNKS